ncbi:hypothetical protein HanPI659440_Chr09g0338951 [Helianthus annuus]|nr:hypothetical protein HanPI659440_Chr09g0338951 [Helianthus annuus]
MFGFFPLKLACSLQEQEYVGELHGILWVGHGSHIVTMPTTLSF